MHHENMHKLASLRFLKLNLEYQNINMGRRTYEHLSFNLYGTGIMQSNTTVVCMVAVSFGGVAIMVAILHQGALRSLLGERLLWWLCFIRGHCTYGWVGLCLLVWAAGRGVFGAGPGFCVGWRTAAHCGGRGIIAVLRGFFATGGKVFILVGGLGAGLSFCGF